MWRLLGIVGFWMLSACATLPPPDLDHLYTRLQSADDAGEAEAIRAAIEEVWLTSGDAKVDALAHEALAAADRGDLAVARILFDRVIAMAPDFVQGWTWRASVRILQNDLESAAADLQQALVRDPRHFEALASLGSVLVLLRHETAAIRAYRAALAINPYFERARLSLERLEGRQGIAI